MLGVRLPQVLQAALPRGLVLEAVLNELQAVAGVGDDLCPRPRPDTYLALVMNEALGAVLLAGSPHHAVLEVVPDDNELPANVRLVEPLIGGHGKGVVLDLLQLIGTDVDARALQ